MGKVKDLMMDIEQELYGDWDSIDRLPTYEEIAEKYEISVEAVHEIHKQLIDRFREPTIEVDYEDVPF